MCGGGWHGRGGCQRRWGLWSLGKGLLRCVLRGVCSHGGCRGCGHVVDLHWLLQAFCLGASYLAPIETWGGRTWGCWVGRKGLHVPSMPSRGCWL